MDYTDGNTERRFIWIMGISRIRITDLTRIIKLH
jgi:hypothetical protein